MGCTGDIWQMEVACKCWTGLEPCTRRWNCHFLHQPWCQRQRQVAHVCPSAWAQTSDSKGCMFGEVQAGRGRVNISQLSREPGFDRILSFGQCEPREVRLLINNLPDPFGAPSSQTP